MNYLDKFRLDLETPFLSNEMAEWYINLADAYIVYSLRTVTIYFNKDEDRTAFIIKFPLKDGRIQSV
jgi:hypothetical protein